MIKTRWWLGMKLGLLLVASQSPNILYAQTWFVYTRANGLVDDDVRVMYQSRDGAMWFGTRGGVSRFDGIWQTFNTQNSDLIHDAVSAIFQSRDGAMWFGTRGGVSRFDGQTWQAFTPQNSGLPASEVASIYQSQDGLMWFGTGDKRNLAEGSGVSQYNSSASPQTAWQTFNTQNGLAHNSVWSIMQTHDGSMWFGTHEGGISRFNPSAPQETAWQTFNTQNGLIHNTVWSIVQDRQNGVWIGTGAGINRYDPSTGILQHEPLGPQTHVQAIVQDIDNNLWFGTGFAFAGGGGTGVFRYDPNADTEQTAWQTLTQENTDEGLVGDIVQSIVQTRDGALWFATNFGVSRYEDTWQTLTKDNSGLLENGVWAIYEDRDNNLWFSTTSLITIVTGGQSPPSISRYNPSLGSSTTAWQSFKEADGIPTSDIRGILQDQNGDMWFTSVDPLTGNGGGVARYNGTTWQSFTTQNSGLPNNNVWTILEDQHGILWFGSGKASFLQDRGGGGVTRYDPAQNTWQTFTPQDGLAGDTVIISYEDRDGDLWFGTGEPVLAQGQGLSRYDGHTWQTFNTDNGLAHNIVLSIFQDRDGVIWIGSGDLFLGTGGGLSRYDGHTWQTFDTKNSPLAGDVVLSIFQERDGALWFGTETGASRFDGTNWQTYTEADGLPGNVIFDIHQTSDGAIWFGTNNGLSRLRRPETALVETAILSNLSSQLGINRFTIRCKGFEIGASRQTPLSYALTQGTALPNESDWHPFVVDDRFELTETQLRNGSWTFYVRAKDRYGNIDPTPATFHFTIDLTAPNVVITTPRRDDAISGDVTITGSVFDASQTPDLKRYTLSYKRPQQTQWQTIMHKTFDTPQNLEDTVLGTWNTTQLPEPFGDYTLRLWAEDNLGHTNQHQIPVTVVSASQTLPSQQGGTIASPGVSLTIPPNGLSEHRDIIISFVPMQDLPSPPQEALATNIAYTIGPATLRIHKRSTLSIKYDQWAPNLAVYMLTENTWEKLGGTINTATQEISVSIQNIGTYALFQSTLETGLSGIFDLTSQPRIISPSGSLYPAQTDISFRLGQTDDVTARVFGISGSLIATLENQRRLNSGWNTLHWNGRDRNNQIVKDGLYIITIQTSNHAANKTVAVLNR